MKLPEVGATVSELGVVAAIAVSHMSMPNHWLPYALVGAGQQWSVRRTVLVTFAGATGHALMTIIAVGVLSGLGGAVLSHEAYRALSSLFLLVMGGYYLYSYFVQRRRNACCGKERTKDANPSSLPTTVQAEGGADGAAVLSLIAMTSLSPCVGSMPVLLAFLKPPLTVERVVLASTVLQMAAAGVMCSLVTLFMLGANRVDFGQLRRHERLFLGVSFVALAALTYFVFANEGHGDHMQAHAHHAHHGAEGMAHSERMWTKSHHSCGHH